MLPAAVPTVRTTAFLWWLAPEPFRPAPYTHVSKSWHTPVVCPTLIPTCEALLSGQTGIAGRLSKPAWADPPNLWPACPLATTMERRPTSVEHWTLMSDWQYESRSLASSLGRSDRTRWLLQVLQREPRQGELRQRAQKHPAGIR